MNQAGNQYQPLLEFRRNQPIAPTDVGNPTDRKTDWKKAGALKCITSPLTKAHCLPDTFPPFAHLGEWCAPVRELAG
jgi:hypothetical protein